MPLIRLPLEYQREIKLKMDRNRKKLFGVLNLLVLFAFLITACTTEAENEKPPVAPSNKEALKTPENWEPVKTPVELPGTGIDPSVSVEDQPVLGGQVKIEEVGYSDPGWIVIHAEGDGQPGAVIGYAPIQPGENKDVLVKIDVSRATPILYAMLHVDLGQRGTFEFPGPDVPVAVNNQPVVQPFLATDLQPTNQIQNLTGGTVTAVP